MKKVQIVSLAIVFVAMNVCCAQGGNDKEFEKNFKELTLGGALGNSIDLSQMGTSFAQIARGVVGADKAQAKTQEYLANQFETDFMSVVSPYYKDVMSVEDVKYLLERCNTPEGKSAVEHCAILNGVEGQTQIQSMIMPVMMSALQGLPYEKIEAVDCPESYRTKCNEYLKATGSADDLIENLFAAFGQMGQQFAGEDEKEQLEEFNAMMNNLKVFMVENLPVIYLNMSYGEITEADFDFFIDLYSSQAGKNYLQGTKALTKDVMNFSMQLVQKFSDWLQENK